VLRIWAGLVIAFTLVAAVYALQSSAQSIQEGRPESSLLLLRRQLTLWWIRSLLAPLPIAFARLARRSGRVWGIVIVHGVGAGLFAVAAGIATGVLDYIAAWSPPTLTLRQVLMTNVSVALATGLLAYLLIAASYEAIRAVADARQREVQYAELGRRLAESQLHILRMQLQPHFLFNALNSVSALMGQDVRRARVALSRLGDLLRKSIEQESEHEVSLKEELELVDAYIDIQRMRFGERLCVRKSVGEDTIRCRVPSFLLQPLLENAIKYGVERRDVVGVIDLRAERHAEWLVIEVADNGSAAAHGSNAARSGMGLRNVKGRLASLYGEAYSLELASNSSGGTTVTVTVPWQLREEPQTESGASA
jgi:two-component system, LytTR family, sensor kinase